jgi:hypothetical protein
MVNKRQKVLKGKIPQIKKNSTYRSQCHLRENPNKGQCQKMTKRKKKKEKKRKKYKKYYKKLISI